MSEAAIKTLDLKLEDVARKYHVMAALPNIGVEKNGAPFSATTRPTYTKPGSYGEKKT